MHSAQQLDEGKEEEDCEDFWTGLCLLELCDKSLELFHLSLRRMVGLTSSGALLLPVVPPAPFPRILSPSRTSHRWCTAVMMPQLENCPQIERGLLRTKLLRHRETKSGSRTSSGFSQIAMPGG